jgi:uncharacterized protein (DUF433 family)
MRRSRHHFIRANQEKHMTLSVTELEQLLRHTDDLTSCDQETLLARYIEDDPYRSGPAEVRIKDYGTPVWALIGYVPAVNNDLRQVATDYDIPLDAVLAAVHFYTRHKAAIDARIEANYSTQNT